MSADDPANPAPLYRIQENVLANAERRLLNWICPRLPAWMTPDVLTGIGVIGAVIVFLGYALSDAYPALLWCAILGYVVQWFGDSLDGSVARWRKIERPRFGYFIDHSVDGLVVLLILAGMGASPFMRMDVALFALAGYLLLSIHAYLSARVLGEFKLSYLAGGPTELRFVLIALTLVMIGIGPDKPRLGSLTGFDLFVLAAAIVLVTLFIVQTMIIARRLNNEGG